MTEPALPDLLEEIGELRDKPVPDQELADAKRAIVGSLRAALWRIRSRCSATTSTTGCTDCRPTTGTRTRARVSAVTAAQAQAAAQKYWAPSRLQIVAVGDATKVADILRKKGDLQVYDADGHPLK